MALQTQPPLPSMQAQQQDQLEQLQRQVADLQNDAAHADAHRQQHQPSAHSLSGRHSQPPLPVSADAASEAGRPRSQSAQSNRSLSRQRSRSQSRSQYADSVRLTQLKTQTLRESLDETSRELDEHQRFVLKSGWSTAAADKMDHLRRRQASLEVRGVATLLAARALLRAPASILS